MRKPPIQKPILLRAPARRKICQPVQSSRRCFIGDSTVRNGQGTGTGGQWGWGDFLAPFFDTNRINVVNCAHGGTSSRTFYRDQWPRVAAMLKPGDCVIMQFGHNDGGPVNDASRARGTIKGVGAESQEITNLITKKSEVVHTFGWYLAKFVTDAKARGATAIICSPIPHKQHWEGGRDFASIADWDEQAAKNNGALFFDLTMVITGAYKKEGADKVATFFADKGTHTTGSGAQFNAACVIAGLKSLPNEPLEKFFSEKSRTVEPYKPDTQDISTNTSPLQP